MPQAQHDVCFIVNVVSLFLCGQDENARQELHALGHVDGHEGQQSLSIKFCLQPGMQEGNSKGMNR